MAEYKAMLQRQREYFRTGETKSVEFRVRQLERMAKWIQDNEEDIMDALKGTSTSRRSRLTPQRSAS